MGRTTNKQRRDQQAATARARAAAARAEQKRQEQRRRAMTIIGSVVAVAVLVVVIAVVAITHKPSTNTASGNRAVATSSVVNAVSSVPAATLAKVGAGPVTSFPSGISGQPPLTAGGHPEMLFIGAEFCPYCAAERWSMAVALSRFGTLNGYDTVSSSSSDVDPNTPTLDFYKYHYASKYLTFTAVENETREEKPLQKTTAAQTALWKKIEGSQSYPFVDFGNKYAITGPSFDPATLKGLTQAQIAAQLKNPTGKVSQAINGGANVITAAICKMTNNQPANVCASVASLQAKLGA